MSRAGGIILMKQCICCGIKKPVSEYHTHKRMADGHLNKCKECVRAYVRQWAKLNPEKVKRQTRLASERRVPRPTPETVLMRLNLKRCIGCGQIKHREDFSPTSADGRRRLARCRPCRNEFVSTTPSLAIHRRISRRLRQWVNGKGGKSVESIIGYSAQDLIAHLERQFLHGMRWENMSDWHIDHITPLSSFSPSSLDDPCVKRAWALSNLRPIWAKENLVKSSKTEFLL